MSQQKAILRLESFREHPSEHLLQAIIELSRQLDLAGVMAVIRRWARDLVGADGITFVLVDGDLVHYADEDAISPLWKGQRFPASQCISGWAIRHRQTVIVADILADERIPHDAYRPTFVRSLAIAPIRLTDPIGAIGAYWATEHVTSEREMALLQALADATATAMANVYLVEQLQRAVQVRDDFLRVASHELKTPLAALTLQLHQLKRHLPDGAAASADDKWTALDHSVSRLTSLIEQMVNSHDALAGNLVPLPAQTDLRDVLYDAVKQLQPTADRAGCRLQVEAPHPVLGVWDRTHLLTVVANLVVNAIKYGAGKPVLVQLETSHQVAKLTVTDQGIGIADSDQQRIFERFNRAVAIDHYGGFGLGLWLTRAIIEAHRGRITVVSALGAGASFVVELPLTPFWAAPPATA